MIATEVTDFRTQNALPNFRAESEIAAFGEDFFNLLKRRKLELQIYD